MSKSIIQSEKECFFCKSRSNLEKHHIFGGASRKKSERYGLTVYLCHSCHNEPPNGVHHNQSNNLKLKKLAQRQFMKKHQLSISDFINEFGKSYI